MTAQKLTCETCGNSNVPVPGVTVVWSRGYYWCAHCADIESVDGEPIVQFPSNGKMSPDTICEGDPE